MARGRGGSWEAHTPPPTAARHLLALFITALFPLRASATPALAAPLAAPLLQAVSAAASGAAAAVWLRWQAKPPAASPNTEWVGTAMSAMRSARLAALDAVGRAGVAMDGVREAAAATAAGVALDQAIQSVFMHRPYEGERAQRERREPQSLPICDTPLTNRRFRSHQRVLCVRG